MRVVERGAAVTRVQVACDGEERPALCYQGLVPPVAEGDQVLLNTTAVALGLGTGGVHFVVANLSRPCMPWAGEGHILKLRYTPLQLRVLAAAEGASPHREAMVATRTLGGLPVVACELHSQVAPVVLAAHASWAAARAARGRPLRVVYVMTDAAALPLALSQQVRELRARGLLAGTVTAGHAFGGEVETVSLAGALLAGRAVFRADVIVVAGGPGVVGTASRFETTAVAQAGALDTAAALGGRPVAVARLSRADPRPRHRGLSHHTRTVLGEVARSRALLPVPRLEGEERARLWEQLARAGIPGRHTVLELPGETLLQILARAAFPLHSMGRDLHDDPPFFLAAAAAGRVAARLAGACIRLDPPE